MRRESVNFAAWLKEALKGLQKLEEQRASVSKDDDGVVIAYGDKYYKECLAAYIRIFEKAKTYASNPLKLINMMRESNSDATLIGEDLKSIDLIYHVPWLFHPCYKKGKGYVITLHHDCYKLATILRVYFAWLAGCHAGLIYPALERQAGAWIDQIINVLDARIYIYESQQSLEHQIRSQEEEHQKLITDLDKFLRASNAEKQQLKQRLNSAITLLDRCQKLIQNVCPWINRECFVTEASEERYREIMEDYYSASRRKMNWLGYSALLKAPYLRVPSIDEYKDLVDRILFVETQMQGSEFKGLYRQFLKKKEQLRQLIENRNMMKSTDEWFDAVFKLSNDLVYFLKEHRYGFNTNGLFASFTSLLPSANRSNADKKKAFNTWLKTQHFNLGHFRVLIAKIKVMSVDDKRHMFGKESLLRQVIDDLLQKLLELIQDYNQKFCADLQDEKIVKEVMGAISYTFTELKKIRSLDVFNVQQQLKEETKKKSDDDVHRPMRHVRF